MRRRSGFQPTSSFKTPPKPSTPADMWSFGCLLTEAFTGGKLFRQGDKLAAVLRWSNMLKFFLTHRLEKQFKMSKAFLTSFLVLPCSPGLPNCYRCDLVRLKLPRPSTEPPPISHTFRCQSTKFWLMLQAASSPDFHSSLPGSADSLFGRGPLKPYHCRRSPCPPTLPHPATSPPTAGGPRPSSFSCASCHPSK